MEVGCKEREKIFNVDEALDVVIASRLCMPHDDLTPCVQRRKMQIFRL
jgi:hypothetical protein